MVHMAMAMCCIVGRDLVNHIIQAAQFLSLPESLFAGTLTDPALFKDKVAKLELLAVLWDETFRDIVPFCQNAGRYPATERVAERSVQCIRQFLTYVALAEEIVSLGSGKLPAATLRSLLSKLLELGQAPALDAMETFVTRANKWPEL